MRILTSLLTGAFMTLFLGATGFAAQSPAPEGQAAPKALGDSEKAATVPELLTGKQEQLVRLSNGFSVLILKDTRFPLVSTRLYVHAGSAYERPEQAGISHVLEHMVFKGTESRPKSRISQEVEAAGGEFNAMTSFDYTVYLTDLPARHWKLGMDVVRDMAFHATLDPVELEAEKNVIVAELKRGQDDPGNTLFWKSAGKALSGTPYEHPVIGSEQTIRAVTVQSLRAYIAALYQPQNMLLVVVGDVEPKAVLAAAEELFGGYKNHGDLQAVAPLEASLLPLKGEAKAEPSVTVQPGPWNKVYLTVSFPVPGGNDYRSTSLDILAYLLGGDQTSLFYRTYKYERQLVDSISVSNQSFERVGLFSISAVLDADKVEPFWKALTADLNGLDMATFTARELERARLNYEDDLYRSKETLSSLASKIGYFAFLQNGEQGEKNLIEAVGSMEVGDLEKAFRTWIRPERMTAVVLPPQGAPLPDFMQILTANWKQTPAKTEDAATASARTETIELGDGRTVVLIPDATMPYLSVALGYTGGDALITKEQQGLPALAARVLTKGTTGRSAADIQTFLADRASGLVASAGHSRFSLSMTGPSRFSRDLFALLGEVVKTPVFAGEEVERGIRDQIAAIRTREDQPLGLAFRKLPAFLFPESAYGYKQLGEPDTVAGLKGANLQAYWEKQRRLPWVLAVSGQFDREAVLAFARTLPVPDENSVHIASPEWGTGKTLDIPMPDRQQAHLMLLFKTAPDTSPDAPALAVLENALSGMGGVLFRDLRDTQGLGYTVTAFSQQNEAYGMLIFYIGTSPDKLEQAEAGFRRILASLHTERLPAEDITRSKNQLESAYYRETQSLGSRASEAAGLLLADRPLDFPKKQLEAEKKVTPEQLKEIVEKYLVPGSEYVIKVLP